MNWKGLASARNAAGDEYADFFEPTGGEHRGGARVDACVERGARRQQAELDDFVALQRVAAAAMDFGDRFSGEQAQFDGANYFLRVAGGDARGGFRIQAREHAMQMLGTMLFGFLTQARANFFGALRSLGESFEQRAKVQAGSGGEYRQNFTVAQIAKNFQGAAAVITGSKNFSGLDEINQVVRDAVLFGRRNLSRADIEMAIDLRGIADQDFAAEFFGEMDAQRGFAGGGGAKHNNEPRQRVHPENFQWRSRRASNTSAARSRAPITCVRLIFMAWPVDTLSLRGRSLKTGCVVGWPARDGI